MVPFFDAKSSNCSMNIPSPLQEVVTSWSTKAEVKLFVKRDDLIHPLVSGNKFRKLKYNLLETKEQGIDTILSFGGAYSNHIHALAAACSNENLKSIGIIRGDEIRPLNPTLQFAEDNGMQLYWITRAEYRHKTSVEFIEQLKERFGQFYLVPEGGTNELAIRGTSEIIPEIETPFDYVCTGVGTGGTIAGLIKSCPVGSKVLGFSALKGDFLIDEVKNLLDDDCKENQGSLLSGSLEKEKQVRLWDINCDYHFGGYAKVKPELWDFISEFKSETEIQLEPIYNGKMMYGIKDLCQKGFFKAGETIIALHTGGLQGLSGFEGK